MLPAGAATRKNRRIFIRYDSAYRAVAAAAPQHPQVSIGTIIRALIWFHARKVSPIDVLDTLPVIDTKQRHQPIHLDSDTADRLALLVRRAKTTRTKFIDALIDHTDKLATWELTSELVDPCPVDATRIAKRVVKDRLETKKEGYWKEYWQRRKAKANAKKLQQSQANSQSP